MLRLSSRIEKAFLSRLPEDSPPLHLYMTAPAGKGSLPTQLGGSTERGDPGLGAPEYQRVDVVRAFVGVDRLEVHHVADYVELVGDAVAAVHVAARTRDLERLAARIALQQGHHLGCGAPL